MQREISRSCTLSVCEMCVVCARARVECRVGRVCRLLVLLTSVNIGHSTNNASGFTSATGCARTCLIQYTRKIPLRWTEIADSTPSGSQSISEPFEEQYSPSVHLLLKCIRLNLACIDHLLATRETCCRNSLLLKFNSYFGRAASLNFEQNSNLTKLSCGVIPLHQNHKKEKVFFVRYFFSCRNKMRIEYNRLKNISINDD